LLPEKYIVGCPKMVLILPAVMIFAFGLLLFDNTCTPLPLWSYQIATVASVDPEIIVLRALVPAAATAAVYGLIAAEIFELKLNLVVLTSG
jgi:hypothetical protein